VPSSLKNGVDAGGVGGGIQGGQGNGDSKYIGKGGTQIAGGSTGTSHEDKVNGPGRFFQGGYQGANAYEGGGGGGGWYGGGAGSDSGGGGGSGWVYTQSAFDAWKAGKPADANQYALASSGAYSSTYGLTDTSIMDGATSSMPNPLDPNFDPKNPTASGQTMTGNARGGFVRIVYLGA
jgi:hypothetical protein